MSFEGGLATFLRISHHGVIGSICLALWPSFVVSVLWLLSLGCILLYETWFLLRSSSLHTNPRGTDIISGGGKRYSSVFPASDLLLFPMFLLTGCLPYILLTFLILLSGLVLERYNL